MSHEALSPQQFFHVSPHLFKEGEEVQPGHGEGQFKEGHNPRSHVYLAENQEQAAQWGAVIGAGRHSVMHMYEVEPHDQPVEEESGFYGMPEHRSSGATVRRHVRSFDPADE